MALWVLAELQLGACIWSLFDLSPKILHPGNAWMGFMQNNVQLEGNMAALIRKASQTLMNRY